jgi:hypothetical protein
MLLIWVGQKSWLWYFVVTSPLGVLHFSSLDIFHIELLNGNRHFILNRLGISIYDFFGSSYLSFFLFVLAKHPK